MLDERKAGILGAVVEAYIETAQPVGSSSVARSGSVDVSSSTIRNEMALLESEGYLDQPHTSAGRIPTEKAYRFFVDNLLGPVRLDRVENQQIKSFFDRSHIEIEQMLQETSNFLASLTGSAGVVLSPDSDHQTVRSVHLVDLSLDQILLVLVTSNGVVEKYSLDISKEISINPTELDEANQYLSKHFKGFRLGALPKVPLSGNDNVDCLVKEVEKTLSSLVQSKETVYVGGTSVLAGSLSEPEGIRKVLDLLERQMIVVSLIRGVIDRGLSVVIGTETGVDHLAECSLVVAPYEIDGEAAGSIGILGPTRMDYTQALATVGIVGRSLGDHLTEG